ncbi:hypothetical protein [Photobacterium leiognathi]|uniref:hypothetical protein n=1 Tax=Photobacterium leiognathi TaxID=553611 RepID=UPI002981897F|nr:hypothetical protein [Photobacterium leiognathi]
MEDNVHNPFGGDSIKGFIKNNYSAQLDELFLSEKNKGYEEGKREALIDLQKEKDELDERIKRFESEVNLFNQRKSEVENNENLAKQRVVEFITYIENTENAIAKLREDSKADIIFVLTEIFKSVYDTGVRQQILLNSINQVIDSISNPSIIIEISEHHRKFIDDSLINNKIILNDKLSEMQARIHSGKVYIDITADNNQQIFKQNLLDIVNAI